MRIRRVRLISRPKSINQESLLTSSFTARPLHLFRALLRECTYLPDPSARNYMHHYVVARFHANKTARPSKHRGPSKRTKAILGRRQDLLKKAHKGLKLLCRANYGHVRPLSKILALTYGRMGPRKHELLTQLKRPTPVNEGSHPPPVKDPQNIPQWRASLTNQHVPLPTPQLTALLKSQALRKEQYFTRKPLKKLEPQIPDTNAWGRPTPIKRARNIKRKWYADALHRAMPPLPEPEWELLRKKAFGETYLSRPIRRRGLSEDNNIGRETYKSERQIKRPHTIHARFMRRLWAKVFQQCPLMTEDPDDKLGWRVTWSDVKVGTGIGLGPMRSGYHNGFDGVDENGKLQASSPG